MKIKILTKEEKEIDVVFPVYKQYGNSLYRLDSERKYVGVVHRMPTNSQLNYSIEINTGYESTIALFLSEGTDITKDEFDSAYENVLSVITRNDFIESTEPATEQEIREKITANMFVDDLPF